MKYNERKQLKETNCKNYTIKSTAILINIPQMPKNERNSLLMTEIFSIDE